MEFDGFDWDAGNRGKCRKHGVSIAEVEFALQAQPRVRGDPEHSREEARFRAIGRNGVGRPIFVVFTMRRLGGRILLRPISARYMHAKEVRTHEPDPA